MDRIWPQVHGNVFIFKKTQQPSTWCSCWNVRTTTSFTSAMLVHYCDVRHSGVQINIFPFNFERLPENEALGQSFLHCQRPCQLSWLCQDGRASRQDFSC